MEVALEGCEEVRGVDADVDEDIQGFDLGYVDGDQAAVGIVDEEVTAQGARSVVIYTACAVSDVAHNEGFDPRAELRENVGYRSCEDQEALWKLESDALRARCAYSVDSLGNLERVVPWEELNGGLDVGIFEDLRRHLV